MVLQTTVGVPKIEDYLSDLKKRDRHQLSDFIKQLQYTLDDAISHLGNADVSIVTATTIRTIHTLLHEAISGPSHVYERTTNTIRYVIKSLQKQNIRLLSDKSRRFRGSRVRRKCLFPHAKECIAGSSARGRFGFPDSKTRRMPCLVYLAVATILMRMLYCYATESFFPPCQLLYKTPTQQYL